VNIEIDPNVKAPASECIEVSTIRVSGWDQEAPIAPGDSLSHSLTRMVLTSVRG